ncbi:sensor domain-containing diguanylate cyclase [Phycisphaera mikurensis]|uniref:diguanylate cyclase n=1 Tax=Phycisphaera mikurensis (strain NBRC 102666 / KCTC 22515 / FYK2301M01) TaxID=1142394 RepID=I0IBB0_PHYMF|nr:GGDEF domain-containing protein [Phycisphaera mikurensis]MBB6443043.1 diguanylate cyclase (GGDEF)-like protein [Phycisphaera mikurensis]BAM02548.1 hypothetical protein PSMK_03890 [Phycisphaera mikurensis NBRC 102666]
MEQASGENADAGAALLERLLGSPRMPSLPAVAAEVLDLVEEEEVDLARVAETITKDPALATRVLRTVNSSFYGQAYAVGTVNHALVVLGLRAVKTLTLGFSLVGVFNEGSQSSEAFDVPGYWRRSLLSAVAAKQLAEAARLESTEECFLGGLLRDVGVLCLQQSLGAEYEEVLAEGAPPAGPWGEPLARAEAGALGADHATLAADLCKRWRLPVLLTALIRHHHRPQEAPEDHRLACACVHAGGLASSVFMAADAEGTDGDATAAGTALARFREAVDGLADQAGFPMDAEAIIDGVHNRTAEMRRLFDLPATEAIDGADLLRRARAAQEAVALASARQADLLERESQQLREDAEVDALTGLPNRRRFDRELAGYCSHSDGSFALVMLDIDHFKSVNDTHGHDAGDAILSAVASITEAAVASEPASEGGPIVCRLGGEEFALLVPGVDLLAAARLADRVRRAVEAAVTPLPAGGDLGVTLSAGVCAGRSGAMPRELYKLADRALYAAKDGGRNTIRAFREAA